MSYVPPIEKAITKEAFCSAIGLFVIVITASNYLVAFTIGTVYIPFFDTTLNLSHVTYGALTYPFSFLIMDVLSEKYNRKDVLRALRYGLLIAFVPSCAIAFFASDPELALRIAIASVSAFFIAQFMDVIVFFKLKEKFPSLWWLRSGVAVCAIQCLDTFIFFHIAFLGVFPYYDVFMLFLFDYMVKSLASLINIPLFYFFAIRMYRKMQLSK